MSGAQRRHDLEFELLDAYFRSAGTVDVQLIRLRDRAEAVEHHRVSQGDWANLRRSLQATVYDGATNAGGWKPDPSLGEYLLFSEGLFNYGQYGFPAFNATQQLYAVQTSAAGDATRLAALAASRNGRAIMLTASGDLENARIALLNHGPRLVQLEGLGVTDLVTESHVAERGFLRIAGRLTEPTARLRIGVDHGGRTGIERMEIQIPGTQDGELAARMWARYSLAALRADPERNRAAIAELGRTFGMVTPETSLLVLDDVADYVRYDITPPTGLRADFARVKTEIDIGREKSRQSRLDDIAAEWAERIAWWEKKFPKDRSVRAPAEPLMVTATEALDSVSARQLSPMPPPPPAPQSTGSAAPAAAGVAAATAPAAGATIILHPWKADSPIARRLRQAASDEVYAIYLTERQRQTQGTAFYLDVADILFEKKKPELALRVLSNLAEMDLENRHVLRVLGYRLMQAEQAELAVSVLERVLSMGEEEPQSYRDLGLAYAAVGQRQKAAETLYEVVEGDWDRRFPGVAQIALAELNAIVAASPKPVDTSGFDPRLMRHLPMGLRTVLSWDSDNSDMDLWVTDPNGEKAFYSNTLTYQGGRMSNDFTGGYGPEEFALRTAKPGTYRVEANFFGDRQQLVTGATTLQLWLSTDFGTPRQQDRKVTLRLKDRRETVLVGEFQVK